MAESFDIAVIGGGNAALSAAMTAAEAGAKVVILEAAPKPYRGGNSRHTRNFRCMHRGPLGPLIESYDEEEYLADLLKVTDGKTDEALARMAIRASEECLPWMEAHGVRFQPSLSGTLSLARTNAFFLGGGKALMNAYYSRAEKMGVNISYESEAYDLDIEDGKFAAARVRSPHFDLRIEAKAVVIAAGGFQSPRGSANRSANSARVEHLPAGGRRRC